jgi:3-deoxy-D-manno-octulosonic-acid transferase
VISTTTKTGQDLAQKIFPDKADAIFYFPFDWKFSVRRALANYKPSIVLLMETEIWPRFIREAKLSGAKVAIVNGRLSRRSFERYLYVSSFVQRVLADIDLALMQGEADAQRIIDLGIERGRVAVTSNLKFEQSSSNADAELTEQFRKRFRISAEKPLIIAASTHEPEERYVLESLDGELGRSCRLMIAPRHPERFGAVEKLLRESQANNFVRRSDPQSGADERADIILLDSIGELRAAYPLAEIVFVGGSLIPHGGQSVLEPAAEGRAVITGPHTANFESVVREFLQNDAILQTSESPDDSHVSERLHERFALLLRDGERRAELGRNAAAIMNRSNRDAIATTIEKLKILIDRRGE